MGFRSNSFAMVFGIEPGKGNFTKVRLSVSRKDKNTGEYIQDFSGYCTFIGQAHAKAARLKEKDRIKLIDVDVSNTYDKEKQKEYVNFKVFDFEMADAVATQRAGSPAADNPAEGDNDADDMPF